MNRFRGSLLLKTVAISLQQIFIIIISITLFICAIYWNYEDVSTDIITQDNFVETNYYKRLVEENIYKLLDYVKYCGKYETDASYDPHRIVDIDDFMQNDRITGDITISLGYTIEQLLKWKEDGFSYSTETIVIPDSDSPEIPYPEEASGETDIPPAVISITRLNESFENINGIPLHEYAEVKNMDYQVLCNSIEAAAAKLEGEVIEYKTQVSSFKANNTNLRYAILDNDISAFYTNLDISSIDEGVDQIMQLDSYVFLDATKADFTSNLFYAQENLNHYLNTLYMNNRDCLLVIGIDTSFSVLDTFYKENLRYNTMVGWLRTLLNLLFISIIGYATCFFYLSASAGHKKDCSRLNLTFFERIKIEPAMLLVFIPEVILCLRLLSIFKDSSNPDINMINLFRIGILVLAINLLFTIGYLSLLRRLKTGTLWSNSLLRTAYSFFKELLCNTKATMKTLMTYGFFLLFLFISLYFTNLLAEKLILSFICLVFGFYLFSESIQRQQLLEGTKKIAQGDLEFQINTDDLRHENKIMGETINKISEGLHDAIEMSIKNERLKTDLITNVSHDIKTPLTSIINYVTLLKRISIKDEKALQYIDILEEKSERLKHLTEDLEEASKISSGNITLSMDKINFVELVHQTNGEFAEKFDARHLTLVTTLPDDPIIIEADGRRIWRVIENIYNNVAKYALENTRVYVDLHKDENHAFFSLKNISSQPLNIEAEELTKRFIRGDVSRSTEGSGLGLSIAKNLTELQGGIFEIYLDGDLFRVTIQMPVS